MSETKVELKPPGSELQVFSAPPRFRWFHRSQHDDNGVLQQAWQGYRTGVIEWRDVEHFYARPE